MNRIIFCLFLIFLCLSSLPGCDDLDGDYSTNPNHRLSFSVDTLSFDTVFTTVGSATRELMIYNRNKEPLKIENILLANPGISGFRINVDGRKGDSFQQVDIRAKDSLHVFVEVTVDPRDSDRPILIEDSIVITTNGVRQSVLLEAYGQDVVLCKGGVTITKDTLITAKRPYLVYDSLVIAEGATAIIEKGTIFYMHSKANLLVQGTIRAVGTMDAPIIFRGDRLDFILNDILPYDRTPGQWGGIFFRAGSYNNLFEHVIIRNGTTGLTFQESALDKQKIKISNSQITQMEENLLTSIHCHIEASNSEFSNAGKGVLVLIGGMYDFTHCTMANYMTLKARSPLSPCLTLSNNALIDKQPVFYPLQRAYFTNSIIDGSFGSGDKPLTGELLLSQLKEGSASDEETFNYRFDHCVMKTKKGDKSSRFVSVLFGESPNYQLTGGKESKYRYDFRLMKESIGIGKADRSVSEKYPVDRYGLSRLSDADGPDIGAYEYAPEKKEK